LPGFLFVGDGLRPLPTYNALKYTWCFRFNELKMKPGKKIKALYLAGFVGLLDWS